MSDQIDLNKYKEFVEAVTSNESNDIEYFIENINNLKTRGINVSLLITGGIGLASESGEFNEIIKKILFQGKPLNEDNIIHMKKELGDCMWYWINACRALNLDPNDVIQENITKLENRYPGGKFDAFYSEHRKKGDI
jgi:NTP pyrophosphatase (non-canonical NTP hydrolase)